MKTYHNNKYKVPFWSKIGNYSKSKPKFTLSNKTFT